MADASPAGEPIWEKDVYRKMQVGRSGLTVSSRTAKGQDRDEEDSKSLRIRPRFLGGFRQIRLKPCTAHASALNNFKLADKGADVMSWSLPKRK
jgi:hypothetical protein